MSIIHYTLYISLFSLAAHAEVGPEKQYFLVNDLKEEWLVYDANYKNYVPYIAEEHRTQPAVSLLIDIESNSRYSLLIYTEKDSYLFINASMNERLKGGSWRVMSIDSLFKKFKKPHLLLTFYGTSGTDGKTVMIAHQKGSIVEKLIKIEEESFLNLRLKNPSTISDFFIGAFLLIFILISYLFVAYGRAFGRFVSLQDLFTIDIKDENFVINRPLSGLYVFFVFLLSLELSYLYYFMASKGYSVLGNVQILSSEQTFFWNIWDYFKLSGIILVFLLLKYVGIYVLSQMYRLEDAVNIHYFKTIQSSLIYYSVLLLICSTVATYKPDMGNSIKALIIIPTITFYILRMILLYTSINKHSSTKNLYLISYLCIAELIPLVIGIRYAFWLSGRFDDSFKCLKFWWAKTVKWITSPDLIK